MPELPIRNSFCKKLSPVQSHTSRNPDNDNQDDKGDGDSNDDDDSDGEDVQSHNPINPDNKDQDYSDGLISFRHLTNGLLPLKTH